MSKKNKTKQKQPNISQINGYSSYYRFIVLNKYLIKIREIFKSTSVIHAFLIKAEFF